MLNLNSTSAYCTTFRMEVPSEAPKESVEYVYPGSGDLGVKGGWNDIFQSFECVRI